ncbi:MAG: hypothetical protein ABSA97_05855 [Verrucomicrobiia bacterium]
MIQKPSQSRRTLAWVLGVLMLASWATGFAGTFTVKITPTGSGQVVWSTDVPPGYGTLTGKGGSFTYTMDSTIVFLEFIPNTNGSIVSVIDNEGPVSLSGPDNNQHTWYGPSENSKKLVVIFSGGSTPPVIDPTGAFGFSFPTNNPSLTAITDLSGTYTGTTVYTKHPRQYNVTVAQDESGKLSGMGTVDGIIPAGGSPGNATIDTGIIGAVTTVTNRPDAQLKGKFEGTIDGFDTTASGSGKGPVAVSDIGGGTNGVTATTATYKANIGALSYEQKNAELKVPVSPDAASHIHKSWNIELNITSTTPAKGKPYITASALLTLPNGEQISFPAKKTKYSAKGYSLSFKGGTNMTIVPNAVDKKTKVSIKGMTLVKTGTTWDPTAGTISYQFLGQKGTADLMDFLGP